MTASPIENDRPRIPFNVGWILWILLAVIMAILVGLRPEIHTVTPEYRGAAVKWFQSEDIYQLHSIHGFLYFPSSALLYWPITLLPLVCGEILWRLMIIGLMAWGTWRLTRLILGSERDGWFWLVTLLTIPACLSSARNGQTNLPLTALMIHTVVDLSLRRWNRAGLWLALTLLLKPIAMVMILLCFALYRPMRLRLIIGFLLVAILPWINLNWAYVWKEHILFLQKMALATAPKEDVFYDLRGLLIQVGFRPPDDLLTSIRIIAAAGVLSLTWLASRQGKEEERAAFLMGALSSAYLLIFNPRTETNSYVLIAPFIAVFALRKRLLDSPREFILLVFLALTLGTESFGSTIFHATNLWLKTVSTSIFLGLLAREILQNVSWAKPIRS